MPGLRLIYRSWGLHQSAAFTMDYPLSARSDETDAVVILFDDVLVPWDWTCGECTRRCPCRCARASRPLDAGGLVVVPSYAELDGPAAVDVTTCFRAANVDAKTRIKLFRLAFAGRLVLFRPPAALRALLFGRPGAPRRQEGVLAAREAKLEEWLDLLTE